MTSIESKPGFIMPQVIIADDIASTLPLEHTLVKGLITGSVASVSVSQRFGNPLSEPAELNYLFPLPENAAITGFELRIGSRQIIGDLKEREVAKAAYTEALDEGKKTALFEQRRPNLYVVRLANIMPGDEIRATITYQQRIHFEDDSYEFIFPMGFTPKYDRPGYPEEGMDVLAPIAHANEKIGQVEIQLVIDAGVSIHEPTSPSHAIEVIGFDERRFQVQLAGNYIPDHDFILRYALSCKTVDIAGWLSGESGKDFFMATIVPPRLEGEPQVQPREFTFVLDRSGSMAGEPIAQARNALRACLRSLNQSDTFRILLFDNVLEWFHSEPLTVNQLNIERADSYLAAVQGRGGTEIIKALNAVLTMPIDPHRMKFVVFLTDGAISAEAQALDQLRTKIGSSRLFTFGIGPSVNRALLSRMARFGHGRAAFLQLDEDIEGAILSFQDSVSFPVLTNLKIEWENAKAWDIYPSRLPDLYYGEPLDIYGRMARVGEKQARLLVRGQRANVNVELVLDIAAPVQRDIAIERIWAQARVDDLIEQQYLDPVRALHLRDDILGLALAYNLVTQYTSFVAVDQDTQSEITQKPRLVNISQPLPQGLQVEGFLGRMSSPKSMNMMPAVANPPVQAVSHNLRSAVSKAASRIVSENRPLDKQSISPYIGPKSFEPILAAADSAVPSGEIMLRWLARNQNLDGSWNTDVETTSAAILAFIRAGYTTRKGLFRLIIRRAVNWLVNQRGTGFAGYARLLSLEALACATGDEQDKVLARAAMMTLPEPSNELERAVLGENVTPPSVINTLDDLRLASILKIELLVPPGMEGSEELALVTAWSASISQFKMASK